MYESEGVGVKQNETDTEEPNKSKTYSISISRLVLANDLHFPHAILLMAPTFLDVLRLGDAFANVVVVPLCCLGHEGLVQARAKEAITERVFSAEIKQF